MSRLARESLLPPALAIVAGVALAGAAYAFGDRYLPVPDLLGGAAGLVPAGTICGALFVIYLFESRVVWLTLGNAAAMVPMVIWSLQGWYRAADAIQQPLARALIAGDPAAFTLMRWGATCLLVGVGAGVIFIRTLKGRRPVPKRQQRRDGPYTAGWIDAPEKRRLFAGDRGLIVGQFDSGGLMRLKTDGHVATIAGTRMGKGVSAILPNLIDYLGSVVVFDPKGENYAVSARARRARGRKVYLLDPFKRVAAMTDGAAAGDRIDFLQLLDRGGPEMVADATMFAKLCATQRQSAGGAGSEGHYFDQEGVDLIRSLVLFLVAATDEELREINVYERSARALRELCTRDHESLLKLMETLATKRHIAGGVVAQSAAGFAKMHFRQWGGVAGTVKEFTNWLADPALSSAVSHDEIDVARILAGEADLYIVAPFEVLQVYRPFPRLLIGMLLTLLQRRVGGSEILFMIDELPQLGYVPPIEDAVFAAAGYGARLWLAIQDHDRFRAVYGRERAESILNMMSMIQVFTVSGTAAKGVAEALGETTIMRRSEAATASSQHRGLDVVGSRSDGTNVSHGEHNRQLMTAEEITRLGREESILLVRGHRPVRARRVKYYEHPAFRGLFDRNPLHQGPQGTWQESPAGARVMRTQAEEREAMAAFSRALRAQLAAG
jgi:type IV secretion system protein VirD4